ncbi:amino acid ABC transporter ATP-binding protein [Fundicoccus culcitae]|uniref:ATP-binding cassette domain-containing protein n=1 Tax=Fundicoccus culcitae TaxID=2969821 RepID=A0ABY5P6V9_9LACT|nr:ATP-binding cassette domain-containing protein [Fundicoccus culcitae]UUX34478.1 ATP-binding cassette domain-containing protein [Fundicoccus culcitae]
MSLKVSKLSKKFGKNQIINQYDFSVTSDEITIVLGESGSGKTTLLRMINNLETVDEGSIELDGTFLVKDGQYQSAATIKEYQQKIGLVFQDYQLFPNLTVLENLLLAPLSNKYDSRDNLLEKAKSLLNQMGIEGKEDVKPYQLSGGQKQRVAIARAMMMNPSLLCFDEPTSALDDKTVSKVAELILQLKAQGMMILIITHDRTLVELLGNQAKVVESVDFV